MPRDSIRHFLVGRSVDEFVGWSAIQLVAGPSHMVTKGEFGFSAPAPAKLRK